MKDDFLNKKREPIFFYVSLLFVALFIFIPANVLADYEDGLFASHKRDYLTAFREFRSLAERGHAKAQVQLGMMYEMGLGIKQDYTKASLWYQKAAIQGDNEGQKKLFQMQKKGLTSTFQPPVPNTWQENTTEPQSQYDIGVMYFKGIGAEKNNSIAFRWFHLAANQGHARAQNDLAVMLSKGLGVQQNKAEAYIWFLRAAEQGFADSQYNLGVMLSLGTEHGMPQHFVLAYMWFEIAAQNGILDARNDQLLLARKMQESQLEEAKSQARKWLTKHGQGSK